MTTSGRDGIMLCVDRGTTQFSPSDELAATSSCILFHKAHASRSSRRPVSSMCGMILLRSSATRYGWRADQLARSSLGASRNNPGTRSSNVLLRRIFQSVEVLADGYEVSARPGRQRLAASPHLTLSGPWSYQRTGYGDDRADDAPCKTCPSRRHCRPGRQVAHAGHDPPGDYRRERQGCDRHANGKHQPTVNAFEESFNGRLRGECLNTHWFLSLEEARAKIEAWRRDYNAKRSDALPSHVGHDGGSRT